MVTVFPQIELDLMEPLQLSLFLLLSLADSSQTLPLPPSFPFIPPISADFQNLPKALIYFFQFPISVFNLAHLPVLIYEVQI